MALRTNKRLLLYVCTLRKTEALIPDTIRLKYLNPGRRTRQYFDIEELKLNFRV